MVNNDEDFKNMKSRSETAVEKMSSGYNCSQSVLYAFSDLTGIDSNTSLKIACGFGSGMAKQDVCGAVTGGIMVIGAVHGRGEGDDISLRDTTYNKVRAFTEKFKQEMGSCNCLTLLENCDFKTEEGRRGFKERELREKICFKAVETAVRIVGGLL